VHCREKEIFDISLHISRIFRSSQRSHLVTLQVTTGAYVLTGRARWVADHKRNSAHAQTSPSRQAGRSDPLELSPADRGSLLVRLLQRSSLAGSTLIADRSPAAAGPRIFSQVAVGSRRLSPAVGAPLSFRPAWSSPMPGHHTVGRCHQQERQLRRPSGPENPGSGAYPRGRSSHQRFRRNRNNTATSSSSWGRLAHPWSLTEAAPVDIFIPRSGLCPSKESH
jgi:hypothetical protein